VVASRHPAAAQCGDPRQDQAVRKWFPSEFTWRLYVVLQVAALMAFGSLVVALLVEGQLLEHRSFHHFVTWAEAEAKCTRAETEWRVLAIGSLFDRDWCIYIETTPQLIRRELSGMKSEALTFLLILLMLAFVVPFAVVRVPTWLWEGWRKG
jgi:hypothetical protein